MDRQTGRTDSFVNVRFTGREQQTTIQRKTLTPRWDEDFRFDVADDAALQNEPLELRLMDSGNFNANNKIGACYISLNPLLNKVPVIGEDFSSSFTSGLSGWYPVFDTIDGIRGELFVIVKVQNVADENPYSESSGSVEFFSSSWLDPEIIAVEQVFGFVEELVVETDPEYAWANNFHTARVSNEARMQLLYRLSMAVRRLVGKKAIELGANAVIAYQQYFDLEGDSGIVCRGNGTACVISKTKRKRMRKQKQVVGSDPTKSSEYSTTVVGSRTLAVYSERTTTSTLRQADDSVYGVVPHPFLLDVPKDAPHQTYLNTQISPQDASLLTMTSFPVNLRVRLAGIVAARSVKYLGKLEAKADLETRDQWWAEIRTEVKSHALALLCNYVVGYSETCVIFDDVCVLSATGTAAVLKECKPVWKIEKEEEEEEEVKAKLDQKVSEIIETKEEGGEVLKKNEEQTTTTTSLNEDSNEQNEVEQNGKESTSPKPTLTTVTNEIKEEDSPEATSSKKVSRENKSPRLSVVLLDEEDATALASRTWSRTKRKREIRRQRRRVLKATLPCAYLHVPFINNAAPFANMRVVPCGVCKNKWVPEVMLSTTEPPPMLPITGGGTLIEARVCKSRGKAESRENDAGSMGEQQLIFLEIELHRQLMLKLKVMGMNAVFSMRFQLQFAYDIIVGVVSGTAIHTPVLPPPQLLKIKRSIAVLDNKDKLFLDLQQRIEAVAGENRERLLKIAIAEAESVQQALKLARERRNKVLDEEVANVRLRKIGESIAKEVAAIALERIESHLNEDDGRTSPNKIDLLTNKNNLSINSAVTSSLNANVSNTGPVQNTNNNNISSWFARRRKLHQQQQAQEMASATGSLTLDNNNSALKTNKVVEDSAVLPIGGKRRNQGEAEIESSRRLLRGNLSLGRMGKVLSASTTTTTNNFNALPFPTTNSPPSASSSPNPQQQQITKAPSTHSFSKLVEEPISMDNTEELRSISPQTTTLLLEEEKQEQQQKKQQEQLQQLKPTTTRMKKQKKRYLEGGIRQPNFPNLAVSSSSSSSSSSDDSSSSSSSSSSDDDSETSDDNSVDLDEDEAENLLKDIRGDKNCFVVEVDDSTDEDVTAVLFDRQTPPNVALCTSDTLPQFSRNFQVIDSGTFVSAIRSYTFSKNVSLNVQLAHFFHQTYALLAFKLNRSSPCIVVGGLRVQIAVPTDDSVVLTLTATVSRLKFRATSTHHQQSDFFPALKDLPLGLPPLMNSVFASSTLLETSPGLIPALDQSPTLGLPNRSPPERGLILLKRQISGFKNFLSRPLKSIRSSRSSNVNDMLMDPSSNSDLQQQQSSSSSAGALLPPSTSSSNITTKPTVNNVIPTTTTTTVADILGISPPQINNEVPLPSISSSNNNISNISRNSSLGSATIGRSLSSETDSAVNFRPHVILSSLEHVPGSRITRYLGRINIHLIKESNNTTTRETSGLSRFFYDFLLQAHAIARAHVEGLGGNALLGFRMKRDSGGQKNQAYNLISLSGDAVIVTSRNL